MGLAGRLGEEWRAEQHELPSLPSCIYLSLHPEEAGGEIRLHTEQWQKKKPEGIQGRRWWEAGGGGELCWAGVGAGEQELQAFQCSGLSLSCRLAVEGLAVSALLGKCHPWGKSSQGRLSSLKGSLESSGQQNRKPKHLQQNRVNPKPSPQSQDELILFSEILHLCRV